MELIDPEAFAPFHAMLVCECCDKKFTVADPLEAHHVRGRWQRMDTPWNLCGLRRSCHTANHKGLGPTYELLLEIVAKRVSEQYGVIASTADLESLADLWRLLSRKDTDFHNAGKIKALPEPARTMGMISFERYLVLKASSPKAPKRKRTWPKRKFRS